MKRWKKVLLFLIFVCIPLSILVTVITRASLDDSDTGMIVSLLMNFLLGWVEGQFIALKWFYD